MINNRQLRHFIKIKKIPTYCKNCKVIKKDLRKYCCLDCGHTYIQKRKHIKKIVEHIYRQPRCFNCGKILPYRKRLYCSIECSSIFSNRKAVIKNINRNLIFKYMSDKEQIREMMKYTKQVMKDE